MHSTSGMQPTNFLTSPLAPCVRCAMLQAELETRQSQFEASQRENAKLMDNMDELLVSSCSCHLHVVLWATTAHACCQLCLLPDNQ